MTDFLLLEQMQKRIKEIPKSRLMFRKGMSVRGFFRPYRSFEEDTKATVFQSPSQITPVMIRFSAMSGDEGTADTMRNMKEMDVKFEAGDGDYDMLCQSLPVSWISSREKLLSLCEILSGDPYFEGFKGKALWSFLVENPEALNCAIRLFSCYGLSKNFIDIDWYSVNTVVWENDAGQKKLVRFKWTLAEDADQKKGVDQKKRRMNRNEAEFMAGFDPHCAMRHLEQCILHGPFPVFELYGQMLDYPFADCSSYTKPTLLWNEKAAPFTAVGFMKLTHFPAERQKTDGTLSFAPGNTIDGISLYRTELMDALDFLYRTEALERDGIVVRRKSSGAKERSVGMRERSE